MRGAVGDAEAVAKAFADKSKGQGLYRSVEVTLLTDRTEKKPTLKNLRDALKELADRTQRDDAVVIFYSGHGAVGADARGEKQLYLLPQDVDMKNLPGTGLAGTEVKQALAEIKARRVLLLLDACYSGAIAPNGLTRALVEEDCGIAVLCAASGKEKAQEKDGKGYFARAVVDGLRGEAPRHPQDHCVYLHHLEQYVIDMVPVLSDDQQHPVRALPPSVDASSFVLTQP